MGVRFTMFAVDPKRLLNVLTEEEASHARKDSMAFLFALRRASDSLGARGIVQPILSGHRRWWVGSFLESLRRSQEVLNTDDVSHIEDLLSLLMGKLDCGATIASQLPSASRLPIPVKPMSDADCHMAVLPSADYQFLRRFISERLSDKGRRFLRPSGPIGIAPNNDDEWEAWVREVMREIAITPLDVHFPTLVSFLV